MLFVGVIPNSKSTSKRVYGPKNARNFTVRAADNRQHFSLLFAINAGGTYLPPFYLFEGSRMPSDLLSGAPPGAAAFLDPKTSYMTKETFFLWFRDHFLKKISSVRPQLLVCDGHESHFSLDLIILARESNIDILLLPSHTSHILQPLDKTVFSSFKQGWENVKR
jgi:hypothetical protein